MYLHRTEPHIRDMKLTLLTLLFAGAHLSMIAQDLRPDVMQGDVSGIPWYMKASSNPGITGQQYAFNVGPLLSNTFEVSAPDTASKTINLALRSFDIQCAYQYNYAEERLKLVSVRKKTTGAIWDKYVNELEGSFPPMRLKSVDPPDMATVPCPPGKVVTLLVEQLAGWIDWTTLQKLRTTWLTGNSALGPYEVTARAWQPGEYQRETVYEVWWPERHIRVPLQTDNRQIKLVTHLMSLTYFKNDRFQAIALRAQAASSLRLELITMITQMQGLQVDSSANWQSLAIERAAELLDKSLAYANPMLFYHLTLPEQQGGCGYPTAVRPFTLPSTDWFFLGYPSWWYPVAYAASNIIHEVDGGWVHTVSIGKGVDHPLPYLLDWSDTPTEAETKLKELGWKQEGKSAWTHPAASQFNMTIYAEEGKLQRVQIGQEPYSSSSAPAIPQMVNRFDEVFLTLLSLHAGNNLPELDKYSQGDKLCPVGFQKDTLSATLGRYQCFLPNAYPEKAGVYADKLKSLLPAAYIATTTTDTLPSVNPRNNDPIYIDQYHFKAPAAAPFVFTNQLIWPTVTLGFDATREGIFLAFDE